MYLKCNVEIIEQGIVSKEGNRWSGVVAEVVKSKKTSRCIKLELENIHARLWNLYVRNQIGKWIGKKNSLGIINQAEVHVYYCHNLVGTIQSIIGLLKVFWIGFMVHMFSTSFRDMLNYLIESHKSLHSNWAFLHPNWWQLTERIIINIPSISPSFQGMICFMDTKCIPAPLGHSFNQWRVLHVLYIDSPDW